VDDAPDWTHEWLTSLVWTAKVTGYSLIGFVLVALLLMRFTRWGRQFRRITLPYFIPDRTIRGWYPLLTIVLVIALNVFDVRIAVLNTYAQNSTATAIQDLSASDFWHYTAIGAIISLIYVANRSVSYFAGQAFAIRWRQWLNDRMLRDWLGDQAYHRGRFVTSRVDNPDQRIQQDVGSFVDDSQTLAFDTVNQVISMVSFTIVLWSLSGPVRLFGLTIPKGVTFMLFVYVLIVSVMAFRIGRPLIRLSFVSERLNAAFRYALVRLRDDSESVAFYRGENVEYAGLNRRFARVIKNAWQVTRRTTVLNGFNQLIDQIAVVVPFVLQAPRLFAGTAKLGDVAQTVSAMGKVHDSLSYFRNTYKNFAQYRATIDRLDGLRQANAEARRLPRTPVLERAEGIQIDQLSVRLPTGTALVNDLTLRLNPGDSLLVTGDSGVGKTTLLRSLAGLWPHTSGTVARPDGHRALFLAQQPYLPLGGLRQALAYPGPPEALGDERAAEVLRQVQLAHLVEDLDGERDWPSILSPGEQQRLGFARVLLTRPAIAFLDEASSALDEGIERMLYDLLRERLPECVVVSVGHRSTLHRMHTHTLALRADGSWSLTAPVSAR
jgi:vitamin B12/bleomycin/antimicrobial peptide transport system ATP-binding/permease protein